MKKLLTITTSFFMISSFAFAQTETGRLMIGGDAQFASAKTSEFDIKTTTVAFNPNVGYFFIDNLAGGLRVEIGSTKVKFDDFEATSTSTSVSPFIRYYFLPLSDNIKLFGDASYGFGSTKDESDGDEEKTDYSGFTISAGPAIFLTENTALEIKAFYNSIKIKDIDGRTNMFGLGVGFQIHL